jgi:hypothetical protein
MTSVKHNAVVLHLPKPVAAVLVFAKQIVQAMSENAYFPTPNPPLGTVLSNIAALDAAEIVAQTKAKGTAGARNLKLKTVIADLHTLRGYVQTIVDANPAHGAAIIESAGLGERQITTHSKPDLEASMGPTPGLVILRAKAATKHAAYEWNSSADGGKTWIVLPITTMADTSIPDLTVAMTYMFRYRTTIGRTTSAWSQNISFLVH